MKMKNKNEGKDSSILRRNSHKMRISAILMFAVALLAITAVSITDSSESDAATGTVASGTADITINVSAWDDTQNLNFTATYIGFESYVKISAAYATDGIVTIPVTRTSANIIGPAIFLITAADLAAATLSPGATITITFTYVVYDEVAITDAGSDYNIGGYTGVVTEGGSYYLERGQSGTINFTLAPSGSGYYRSTAVVSAGITTDIGIYTTDFTATIAASSAPYTIDLTAVEIYLVTVGAPTPTEYAVTFVPATDKLAGNGFRNVINNVGYVDAGYTGTFIVDAVSSDPYYRILDITNIDTPYVPGASEVTATCTVTPIDSTTVVGITMTEVYAVTVGILNPTEYIVIFVPAADETVGNGFRNVSDNVGFVDAGYTGTFIVVTALGDPYFRILDITNIDTPYVPGIFDTSATCDVTPIDSTTVVGITVTEVYFVTVGVPAPTDYTITFVPAADETVGNGFRNVNGNVGFVDVGYTGTFTVDAVFTDPYYRILDITNIDTPYVPGASEITATCTVTPIDSTTVVGITMTEVYAVTVGTLNPTEYTVTFVPAVDEIIGNGFRNVTGNIGYVDVGYTGTFTVDTTFSDPYYRLTEITNIDTPYVPGMLDISVAGSITSIADETISITAVQVYEIIVNYTVGGTYTVTDATVHNIAADGFRQPAIPVADVYYIDAGQEGVAAITADSGYRIMDVTAGNAALPLHYGPSYVVYSLTYTLEPLNDVIFDIVFKKIWIVTLDSNPAEGGTVIGGGIHDDSSVIVIDAIANDGYKFIGWSDGNKTVNRLIAINSNTFLTALFEKEPVKVTIWVIAEDGGSVTGGGKVNVGTSLTISATADSGHKFVKWSDGSTSATRTVTATSDATYIAEFSENADSSDNWNIILMIIIIIVIVIIVAVILFLIFGRKKNEY